MRLIDLIGPDWTYWSVRFDGLLGWQACNLDANYSIVISEKTALTLIRAIKNGMIGPIGKLP